MSFPRFGGWDWWFGGKGQFLMYPLQEKGSQLPKPPIQTIYKDCLSSGARFSALRLAARGSRHADFIKGVGALQITEVLQRKNSMDETSLAVFACKGIKQLRAQWMTLEIDCCLVGFNSKQDSNDCSARVAGQGELRRAILKGGRACSEDRGKNTSCFPLSRPGELSENLWT